MAYRRLLRHLADDKTPPDDETYPLGVYPTEDWCLHILRLDDETDDENLLVDDEIDAKIDAKIDDENLVGG